MSTCTASVWNPLPGQAISRVSTPWVWIVIPSCRLPIAPPARISSRVLNLA
ncbi:MAG: hypothetical protein R2726_00815 [Acidimicrobiales bacterium]